MMFKPSISLDTDTTARLQIMAQAYCGEDRIAPLARELARALRRAGNGQRVKVVNFTSEADRRASRIQLGVVVDGVPDHGFIFGLTGAREGVSQDN